MRTFPVLACLCMSLIAGAAVPAPPRSILVSPAWLAEHLQDPDLVVLQVAGLREDYDREHIPGARFLWLTWIAESTPERSFELPALESAARVLKDLGVTDRSQVVICHTLGDVTGAARAYVTLDRLGLGERTSILDGGFAAWKAEGRPVTREAPKVRRGPLTLKPRPDVIADVEAVAARYRDTTDTRLVDARSAQAFNTVSGTNVVRGGHIPGALNVPSTTLTDSLDRYLPLDSLRARFERAGVRPGQRVIAYCNIGRTAAPLYVVAKLLGHDVRLYDGSFEEWSRRLDLPVEVKAGK